MFFSFTLLKACKSRQRSVATLSQRQQNNFQNLDSELSQSETGFERAISAVLDRFFSIKAIRRL
jgi:hypothetical protein